jgi:hypothetical protein
MIQIDAIPKGFFSWGYDLYLRDVPLVSFDVSWLREKGAFVWDGTHYELFRETPLLGDFVIQEDNAVLARAAKSTLIRQFAITAGERTFVLKGANPFTRRFVLMENDLVAGEFCPNHPFTRKSIAEFPDDLPVPVCVFLFWLVVLMWRRAAGSS